MNLNPFTRSIVERIIRLDQKYLAREIGDFLTMDLYTSDFRPTPRRGVEVIGLMQDLEAIGAIEQDQSFQSPYILIPTPENPNPYTAVHEKIRFKIHDIEKMRSLVEPAEKKRKAKDEYKIGRLIIFEDDLVKFDGEIVSMRRQEVDILRLFMRAPNQTVPKEDIREQLWPGDNKPSDPDTTAAKYVSELHSKLRILYGKKVIHAIRDTGWRFTPG